MDPYDYHFTQDWNHILLRISSLIDAQKIQEAETLILTTLKSDPSNHNLLNAYGVVLQLQQRFEEAVSVLERAAKSSPNDFSIWFNMGLTYIKCQNHEQALRCLNESLKLDSSNLIAWDAKSQTCMRLEDYPQALEALQQALAISPKSLHLLKSKSMALQKLEKYDQLIFCLEEISALDPTDLTIIKALGDLYSQLPWSLNYPKALKYYEQLYTADPNDLEALKRMCFILNSDISTSGDDSLTKARHLVNKLLETSPLDYGFIHHIQNIALRSLDYDLYNKLPPFKELLNYWANQGSLQILADQTARVQTLQDRLDLVKIFQFANDKVTAAPISRKVRQKLNNKIRFGIVSPNLRDNYVGAFIWPLIEHLDKARFELYCYSTVSKSDCSLSSAMAAKSDEFKKYDALTNNITAHSIANDGIDVLLEVSAIARHAALLAAKPAPIQITWLDSTNALGLPPTTDYLDYAVVDPYIQSSHPAFTVKQPMTLPNTWVALSSYQPLLRDINNIIPEDRNGYITFGTMNAVLKLTPELFAVWAEIMHAVPNSRFLYVRPETSAQITRDNFCKHMASHGVTADRISFVATRTDHMSQYNNIDIALDTFPRTGGTTTCETMLMGVPVVTLVGTCLFERISYSNLNNAGLGDLCAFNVEDYKALAIKLAQDKERRRYLRHNLRQQIMQHPLGQAQQFAADFSNAIKDAVGR